MAYKVIILYRLYMPSYFLGTFTEYPYLIDKSLTNNSLSKFKQIFLFEFNRFCRSYERDQIRRSDKH